MRYWKMGAVDGWINGKDKYTSILDAIGQTPMGSTFVFVYEDTNLVAVKDLREYFKWYVKEYGNGDHNGTEPDMGVHLVAKERVKFSKTRRQVSLEMERQILELFDKEEKKRGKDT